MGSLVLFSVVILVMFSSSYGENKFAGLMNLTDRVIVDGMGFCGLICVAPNLQQHLNKTVVSCQNTIMEIANEAQMPGLQRNGFEEFYNFALKRHGSDTSRMCRWSGSVLDNCVGQLVENHCDHYETKQELDRIRNELKAYVCSLDPAVMECAMHPDVMKTASSCVAPLQTQFGKYFNSSAQSQEEQMKQFQRFYDGEIKTSNAESLYSSFKTLGTCVSEKIGMSSVQGTNCSKVQDLLDAEINNVIDYFKETDMLKCTLDPELWRHLGKCVQTFANSLEKRTATLDPFAKDNIQLLKDPLKAFTTCTLRSIKEVCDEKWTYNVAHTKLTLLENLFNPKGKPMPEYCKALVQKQTSSAGTSKTVMVLHVAAAVLLRVLTIS